METTALLNCLLHLLVLAFNAFLVAVVASVWYFVLIQPGHIFGSFVSWVRSKSVEWRERNQWWLKPTVDCNRCIAGQLALWIYLLSASPYHPAQHVAFICLAIFFAVLMERRMNDR